MKNQNQKLKDKIKKLYLEEKESGTWQFSLAIVVMQILYAITFVHYVIFD